MICKNKIIFFLLAFSLSVANESYNHSFDFYSNNVNEINSNMSINPSSGKLEAMLFSAIIPGSGQYLINNQKGKAIVFITAEGHASLETKIITTKSPICQMKKRLCTRTF